MDRVVKIDDEILRKIEDFVKRNKYQYSSNKQVVNLAILEFLKSQEFKSKGKKRQHGTNR